jgi:hypothetical protein
VITTLLNLVPLATRSALPGKCEIPSHLATLLSQD